MKVVRALRWDTRTSGRVWALDRPHPTRGFSSHQADTPATTSCPGTPRRYPLPWVCCTNRRRLRSLAPGGQAGRMSLSQGLIPERSATMSCGSPAIATDYGVHPMTLTKWMRQADVDDGAKPARSTGESGALRDLRRRNRLLE